MRRLTITGLMAAALVAPLVAQAQEGDAALAGRDPALPVVPFGNLSQASDETIARSRQLAEEMKRSMESGFAAAPKQEAEALVRDTKKKVDDIADEALAGERSKVLQFLGLNPNGDTALYYFVSWSMPLEVLRSYAVEAMWSGGTLVFKGVPEGRSIGAFLVEDLRKLVYSKGAAANVSIDPRLYDAFAVNAVPTIVFTTTRENPSCELESDAFKVGETSVTYKACPPVADDKYWKLSGNVTTSFALEQMIAAGAAPAKPYLAALSKGWVGKPSPGKEQVPFEGKWDDVLSPTKQAAALEEAKKKRTLPPEFFGDDKRQRIR